MSDEPNGPRDNAGVIAPPPVVFSAPLVASLAANRALGWRFFPERLRKVVGLPLLLGGLALGVWFFATMKRADTPVDPREPVQNIATDGPFAYTRNPAYLAMTLIFSGVSVLGNSLPSIVLLPIVLSVMESGVIEREERYLERKFGEEYLSYKRRVRRWL